MSMTIKQDFGKLSIYFAKVSTRSSIPWPDLALFHFHVPFHKPLPGIIVGIWQAVVLPPYQDQGNGAATVESNYIVGDVLA